MEADEVLVPHRVVFLDVDGVMNDDVWHELMPPMLALLRQIVVRAQATIVLSSMWRLTKEDRAAVRQAFLRADVPRPVSYTPKIEHGHRRTAEILSWLRMNTDLALGPQHASEPLDRAAPEFSARHYKLPQRIQVAQWVVLDDLDLSQAHRGRDFELLRHHFVRTNARRGLTAHNAEQAIQLLVGQPMPVSDRCAHCLASDAHHDVLLNASFCGERCRIDYRDYHNL